MLLLLVGACLVLVAVLAVSPVALGLPGTGSAPAGAAPAPNPDVVRSADDVRLADALPIPTQDPATSNKKADDILDGKEFQRARPGLFQRFTTWLGDSLGKVIDGLFSGGTGAVVAWAILAAVVGLVVIVVARVVRTVQAEPSRPGPEMQIEVRRCRSSGGARPRGSRLARSGSPRCGAAIGRSSPTWWPAGWCATLAGHTTGEYRADVAVALPDAAAEFAGASELFERAWYGDQPTGPDENARFRELADAVVARAGRPHRGSDDRATAGDERAGSGELVG